VDRFLAIRCAWAARFNASRADDRDERRHWNAVGLALSASRDVHQARARLVGPDPHSAPRVAFLDQVVADVQAADEAQQPAKAKAAPSAARERSRGVPAAAPAVWAYRRDHPRASVPELATAVGCSEQTVRRSLQAQRAA